jgi:hypothetical protein
LVVTEAKFPAEIKNLERPFITTDTANLCKLLVVQLEMSQTYIQIVENVIGCPPGRYLDKTLGVYRCHAAVGTHELAPVNMTNQWQRAW